MELASNINAFYENLEQFGNQVALIRDGKSLSYNGLVRFSDDIAGQLGNTKSLVFLEANNTFCSIAAYIACLRGGHVVFPYARADRDRAHMLAGIYKPNVMIDEADGKLRIEPFSSEAHQLHPDLGVLLSTSGSTGSPKFVKLSPRNITSNADSIVEYLGIEALDRSVSSLKFNYSYGMSVINSHLAAGASVLLSDESVVSSDFWAQFKKHRCTSLPGVPYTFELLEKMSDDWTRIESLRFVTQAGGRLPPALVKKYASLGKKNGWDFFVMYGQTEASPRMAYLPPDHALASPDCIGRAIPGGELFLLDEEGQRIEAPGESGELAYRGPNVMMGYAQTPEDLATDETPPALITGDIAEMTEDGLFRIVGRKSRFLKLFGTRLNLDEMQAQVREMLPDAVCTGTDDQIIIAIPIEDKPDNPSVVKENIASNYHVPADRITILAIDEMPLLSSGKIDYQEILRLSGRSGSKAATLGLNGNALTGFLGQLISIDFYKDMFLEAAHLSGLADARWQSVEEIYAATFAPADIAESSTFTSLAGDSLSYVQVSLALEEYLGFLPENWHETPVSILERMQGDAKPL